MNKERISVKKLGIVTNPSQLDEQDTFFLFVNEAITRPNLEVYVFDADDISGKDAVLTKLIQNPIYFKTRARLNRKTTIMKLSDFDLIFLKKDPPIDKHYERLLKKLIIKKIPTVNNPKGILKMGTKAYLKHFPQITPNTFYANKVKDALKFIKQIGNCVIKQSDSYGGKGVKHIRFKLNQFYGYEGKKEMPLSEAAVSKIIKEYLSHSRDKTILVVEYFVSASKRGDKRIVIIDGAILGSYLRLPDAENGICVCANNGAKLYDPTKRDYEIAKTLQPHFKKNSIYLAAVKLPRAHARGLAQCKLCLS